MLEHKPEHKPKKWVVVVGDSDTVVVVSASCICGDDSCYFTASSYRSEWYGPAVDKLHAVSKA